VTCINDETPVSCIIFQSCVKILLPLVKWWLGKKRFFSKPIKFRTWAPGIWNVCCVLSSLYCSVCTAIRRCSKLESEPLDGRQLNWGHVWCNLRGKDLV
jgi:hypothetical protein